MAQVFTRELFTAANVALLAYDYLITLDVEMKFVWSSPWFIGLPLYYINRYMPLVDEILLLYYVKGKLTSSKTCESVFNTSLSMVMISASAAHTIIYLQTCALWGNHRAVVYGLGALLLGKFVASICFMSLQMRSTTFFMSHASTSLQMGCNLIIGAFYAQYLYILISITETITVGLMLFKGIQHTRHSRAPWVVDLYRTGVLFSLVILILSLLNVIIPNIPSLARSAATLLSPLQHTMESVLCTRVMFVILQRRNGLATVGVSSSRDGDDYALFTSVGEPSGLVSRDDAFALTSQSWSMGDTATVSQRERLSVLHESRCEKGVEGSIELHER